MGSKSSWSVRDKAELEARTDYHFDEVGYQLRKLGIREFVIGGVNLGIHSEYSYYDSGCVKGVMDGLNPYIPEIRLSSFTWPSGRQTLKNNPNRIRDFVEYL